MSASAVIRADSLSPEGVRLTTFEVKFWRPVLAEFNTHRVFSRNSASSRAIPLHKQLQKVMDDPAGPITWASEQKGMQGGAEIHPDLQRRARIEWEIAAQFAVDQAAYLGEIGVHKSIANRLLEPFLMHTVVVTATAWQNFFNQRNSEQAQPEIRIAAKLMCEAYEESTPMFLSEGAWHLPYLDMQTFGEIADSDMEPWGIAPKISAARCARTSYETQNGVRDIQEDIGLYDRLVNAKPEPHWSPLEHVATPWKDNRQSEPLKFWGRDGKNHFVATGHLPKVGNLLGWRQLRTEEEQMRGIVTYR